MYNIKNKMNKNKWIFKKLNNMIKCKLYIILINKYKKVEHFKNQ